MHDFDFHFLGLIGFVDPIRDEVPDAVRSCHNAGIKFFFLFSLFLMNIYYYLVDKSCNDYRRLSINSAECCEECWNSL
jgi:hypothetical protein